MQFLVRIQSKDGKVLSLDVDNGPGGLRILRWNGWCLRSYPFRSYLLMMKGRGAVIELDGEPLKVQYHGLFKETAARAKCACGCGTWITWNGGYAPNHGPPYFHSGHRSKVTGPATPGAFKKGHVSWNRGKKGYCPPGAEKGWFKKGGRSARWKDYPTPGIRIDKDGYVYALVDDPEDRHPCGHRRYVNVARVTMEKHLGRPLESNEVVLHLNGNKSDNHVDNLRVVTRSESIRINKYKLLAGKGFKLLQMHEKTHPAKPGTRSPFCGSCGTLTPPGANCPRCGP